jgi:sialic acid synthase SpsE
MKQNNILYGHSILNNTPGTAFIIAEAGINHDGNFEKAKKLIDAAAAAKCSCVKFQVFNTPKYMSTNAISASYIEAGSREGEKFYDLSKKFEFTYDEHRELHKYSEKVGIPWIASFFDQESLDFLVELKVPVLKIASGELNDFPLLKSAAETKIPLILSTGMASLDEIDETLKFLKANKAGELYLMHCVSWYPADVDDMNIKFIDTLFENYGLPVGLSDHTLGISVSNAARARGVKFFEKHYTLTNEDFGPDHSASLEPDELAEMVVSIDEVGRCIGNGSKTVTSLELDQRKVHRKSIVAESVIRKGEIITRDKIAFKRPGTGIPPKYFDEILGYMAETEIDKDEVIKWEMLSKLK